MKNKKKSIFLIVLLSFILLGAYLSVFFYNATLRNRIEVNYNWHKQDIDNFEIIENPIEEESYNKIEVIVSINVNEWVEEYFKNNPFQTFPTIDNPKEYSITWKEVELHKNQWGNVLKLFKRNNWMLLDDEEKQLMNKYYNKYYDKRTDFYDMQSLINEQNGNIYNILNKIYSAIMNAEESPNFSEYRDYVIIYFNDMTDYIYSKLKELYLDQYRSLFKTEVFGVGNIFYNRKTGITKITGFDLDTSEELDDEYSKNEQSKLEEFLKNGYGGLATSRERGINFWLYTSVNAKIIIRYYNVNKDISKEKFFRRWQRQCARLYNRMSKFDEVYNITIDTWEIAYPSQY